MGHRRGVLVAIIAAAAATALPSAWAGATDAGGAGAGAGSGLVVLLHHPYPDTADPFGFPYPPGAGLDAYLGRYQHLDEEGDGFDFPHATVDGLVALEGIPDPAAPFASTRAAYEAGYRQRATADPPVLLHVAAQDAGGSVLAVVEAVPRASLQGERLHLWVALVEDHVFFDGGRLGNGITDHRFTVRALRDLGALDLAAGAPQNASVDLPVADDYAAEQLYVAAWLQQDASHGLRFDAHEVVQAAIHHVAGGGVTTQSSKAVLLEMYSATWCGPCLYGDLAAEEMAAEYGVAGIEPDTLGPRYFHLPRPVWLVAAAALAAGAAMAAWRVPGGKA